MSDDLVETDENGEAMFCTGCGTTRTLTAIKTTNPRAVSCCPERKMAPVRTELTTLRAQLAERDAQLAGMRELAIKAHAHWDADEDMKAGKIIMAIAGINPGYDARADAIDTFLTKQGDSA